MLLDRGADVYAVDANKRTPLHALALCGTNEDRAPVIAEAAKSLIEAGLRQTEGRSYRYRWSSCVGYTLG